MIDPALDKWVWATAFLLLAVVAVRSWVVETGQGSQGRAQARVRVLTITAAVVLAGLTALLSVQGGNQLVNAVVSGTDPAAGPADPAAPVDPAVPVDG